MPLCSFVPLVVELVFKQEAICLAERSLKYG